jgi:hypothetical protein
MTRRRSSVSVAVSLRETRASLQTDRYSTKTAYHFGTALDVSEHQTRS